MHSHGAAAEDKIAPIVHDQRDSFQPGILNALPQVLQQFPDWCRLVSYLNELSATAHELLENAKMASPARQFFVSDRVNRRQCKFH
jgi:hypothetical protein